MMRENRLSNFQGIEGAFDVMSPFEEAPSCGKMFKSHNLR